MEVQPKFTSTRSSLPTHGRRVAALSAGLGLPFMPWQNRTTDLINEFDPVTNLRTRSLVLLTVQRQAGKTALVLSEAVERCLFGIPGFRVYYTAQSGAYARQKWAEMIGLLIKPGSPLAGYVQVKWSQGSECATFPNGSTFRPFPPKKDALHSLQTDLVIVDEAWVHDHDKGTELSGAIGPTQATRPGAQTIILSAMGTAESTWFHPMVDEGRKDPDADGMTYVEYGIGPDGDPGDIEALIAAHPAVGHTIDRSFILKERTRLKAQPGEFVRGYGNARTKTENRYIDLAVWTAAESDLAQPLSPAPVFGVAVALGSIRAAIVSCAGGILEVVDSRPGVEWIPDRLTALVDRHQAPAVYMDATGPADALWDQLNTVPADADEDTRRRRRLVKNRLVDAGPVRYKASRRFLERLTIFAGQPDTLRYMPHDALDEAADSAVPRNFSDGSWTWGRRLSGGPIAEIEAATWAAYADEHRPVVSAMPLVVSY